MNLAKTQAQFDRFYGGPTELLCAIRELYELRDKQRRERTQVWNENDATSASAHFTAVSLTGVVFPTTTSIGNTSNDGLLYVRITANGGNWDVNLYKATGGSGLVAHATNVAASGTSALTADNSSGIGGSITLGATIAAETNDRHRLRISKDYRARLDDVFPADGTITMDMFSRTVVLAALDNAASRIDAAIADLTDGLSTLLLGDGETKGMGNDFLLSAETSLYRESFTVDSEGNRTLSKTGLMERLRLAMQDNTTVQSVKKRTLTVGSETVTGDGAFNLTMTVGERAPSGTVVLQAVKGIDTGDLGREQFDGYYAVDESGDQRNVPITGVIVGRTYNGPFGSQITLTRIPTKTGDGGNTSAAAASAWSFQDENNTNCPAGILYAKVTGSTGAFVFSFYSAAIYNDAYLVSRASGVSAAGQVVATPQGAGGLYVTGTAGSAPVNGDTWSLNLKPAYVDNSASTSDRIELTITIAAGKGLIQTYAARLPLTSSGGCELPGTSGSATWPDEKLIAGCFPPFIAVDN